MDRQITLWFGELLGSSSLLYETILRLSSCHLIKGSEMVAILSCIWIAKPG